MLTSGKYGAEFVQVKRIYQEYPDKAISLFGIYEKLRSQFSMSAAEAEQYVFSNSQVVDVLKEQVVL